MSLFDFLNSTAATNPGQFIDPRSNSTSPLSQANTIFNDPNSVLGTASYFGNMSFPQDLINEYTGRNFYINIDFEKYQRRSIFDPPTFNKFGGIQLPIPDSLNDRTTVNWTKDTNPTIGAGIEQLLKGNKNLAGSDISSTLSNIGNAVKDNGIAALAGGALAGGLNALTSNFPSVNQALQLGGLAQNPFMTMLFQNPEYKTHSFSWTLTPRNAQESSIIADIIKTFKSNMLPTLSGGGLFFGYPNVALISLHPAEEFLYSFKRCAILGVSVDFTPNGPSFFQKAPAPTQVILSVAFQEIEYWTQEAVAGTSVSNAIQTGLNAIDKAFSATVNPSDGNQSPLQQIPVTPEGTPGYTPGA